MKHADIVMFEEFGIILITISYNSITYDCQGIECEIFLN